MSFSFLIDLCLRVLFWMHGLEGLIVLTKMVCDIISVLSIQTMVK